MRDLIVVVIVSATNCAVSLAATWLFLRAVRWIGQHVHAAFRALVYFPLGVLLALICMASLLLFLSAPFQVFTVNPRDDDQLFAVAYIFAIGASLPAMIYFYRNKKLLKDAKYILRNV